MKSGALYMAVFTLPMYMRLNNMLLAVFIALAVTDLIYRWRGMEMKQFLIRGWPVWCFFVLALWASFYGGSLAGFHYLEKYWSLVLVPLAILPDYKHFAAHKRQVFLALTWGCVVTLIICYVQLAVVMIGNNEPLLSFYASDHVGQRFTAVADTHPTYLGLFVVTSILFLIQDRLFNKRIKVLVSLLLMFGLLQLASRMPLFLFLFFFVFLLVNQMQHKRWQVGILLLGILACSSVFILIGSDYMRDKMFSPEIVVDDKRVQRWEVSYEIFQENPFLGVGYGNVQALRNEKFMEKGYELAASKNYNAHNQFLEYLSTNGAFGGFVYAISLGFLLLLSIYRRDPLFSLIFLAFIIANLTESMMVRIKGIEYFALFASLFLCGFRGDNNHKEYLYPI